MWEILHRAPERTLTARTKHGTLSFSNKDRAIGRLLYTDREFELDKIDRALRFAVTAGVLRERNDGWLLDVGANVGSVCIPLVRRGVVTRALAFEPEPKNYAHLVKSLVLNGTRSPVRTCACSGSTPRATKARSWKAPRR